jgi:predicted transcriptional regulator
VLENDVRAGVYKAIQQRPGARFEELRKELGLAPGALIYHLRVLERERYVSVSRSWTRRVYHATGTAPLAPRSTVAETVASLLAAEPRLSPLAIAERLSISRQLARYHLRSLERQGLVRSEGSGASLVYSRVDA